MRAIPAAADVVVIGGGVTGVGAALALAGWGVSVALCEKGRIAGEQSSRNWGWIRAQGRDRRELPLMLESARLWRAHAAALDEDIGLRTAGVLYLAETEAELAARSRWLDDARDFQIDTRLLGPAQTDAALGRDDRAFLGAVHTPSDMMAEPALAVPALARRAQALGATMLERCAVRTVTRRAGRVAGVLTERGEIACDAVVLAGGAWSRVMMEHLGLSLPQLAVRASALRTRPAPGGPPGAVGATGAAVRRRADGGYTVARVGAARFDLIPAAFAHLRAFLPVVRDRRRILTIRAGADFFGPLGRSRWRDDAPSPFEEARVLEPAPDPALLARAQAEAVRLHPALAAAPVAATWGGLIDVTPDEIPVIDAAPGWPGLVVATGLSGHGFALGLGVGRLAAELATARSPCVDPAPFRLARFAGG